MLWRMMQLMTCISFILTMELLHAVFDKGAFFLMWIVNFFLQFIRELADDLLALRVSGAKTKCNVKVCSRKYDSSVTTTT
uniref:Uncharacterized protein n=1 Tax=Ciona savignyi TaxID=51511 RepID=H2Y867_CIOSA